MRASPVSVAPGDAPAPPGIRRSAGAAAYVAAGIALAACKGPERPRPQPALAQTIVASRDGAALRGVAGDGTAVYAAFATTVPASATEPARAGSIVEARRGDKQLWHRELAGTAGELANAGELVAIALVGRGTLALGPPLELRGDPGAVLVALDRQTGAPRWRLAFDSTAWSLITEVAASGDDLVVAGAFGGTLRVGTRVVSSAGGSDGFVARVTPSGQLAWLVRLGGAGEDGVQGLAASPSRIAIAGTFTTGADLLGHPLPARDDRSPYGDVFVAELDARGALRWSATFGSRADDPVAGVAIDGAGHVVVAASVRDAVSIGSNLLLPQGASDGLVVWYGDGGEQGAAVLLGGLDFDGLRAIAPLGDHVVVGGFFSGALRLAGRELTAGGGDDAFLAVLDPNGTVTTAWHVGGDGREEITSLAAVPGGFVAGIAHTAAATIEDARVPAPRDPGSGATLIVRGF